jgi:structural maintenance of chromosomes protein 5
MGKIRVKQEKLKNKGKQRTRVVEEPEEEDNEQDDEDAPGEQDEGEESSLRGNKRLRVNGGASRPSRSTSQQLPKMKTLPRDTDGYA